MLQAGRAAQRRHLLTSSNAPASWVYCPTIFLQDVERYKQAFQRSGGTPLIDYYRALVDGMALGTAGER